VSCFSKLIFSPLKQPHNHFCHHLGFHLGQAIKFCRPLHFLPNYFNQSVGTYPDFCVQSHANDSYKVFTVEKKSNYSDTENYSTNYNESINCICRYFSLEEALRDLDNDTFVNVSTSVAMLPSSVSISNLHNITIYGHDYPAVDCNYTGSFVCKACNDIVINNIKWNRCGLVNSYSGLRFENHTNLTIQFSTFTISSVQVLQASGAINIHNVTIIIDDFTNSHSSLYETNYGGLVVEQYISTMLEIYVDNCLFTNKFGSTTATAQLFIINTILTSMTINNTTFLGGSNSQATYGNSMVYINISSEASNVKFMNVTFESNNITENGNVLSVLMNEDDSRIQIYSCMFLNNTASNIAFLKATNLEIIDSNFQSNNGRYSLVSLPSKT